MPIDKFAHQNPLLLEAHRALLGLVDAPERALSALLRSDIELTANFRRKLADALEGKNSPIELNVTGLSETQYERSLKRHMFGLKRGQRAVTLMSEGSKYDDAIEQIANEASCGTKTIINDVANARKCDKWIAEQEEKSSAIRTEAVLRDIFVHSLVRKVDPNALLQELLSEVEMEITRSADALGWRASQKSK